MAPGDEGVSSRQDAVEISPVVQPRRARSSAWLMLEWLGVISVALLLAVGVRAYVIQTFYIPSGSMEPTLNVGDRILVFKLAYDFASPAIGDVVVFRAPPSEHCGDPSITDLVKRIVGVPGDRMSSSGNEILVNGKPLVQDWPHVVDLIYPISPRTIPPNDYFVMGDNHPASCDSRVWGYVPRADIIGKVVLKIWPLSQFGTI
ncbi:MAG TPA: signal peptidase I [Acidimicrobiales bacterium]|nr:signal peptidase I [Acidimicrobiales bacterium]